MTPVFAVIDAPIIAIIVGLAVLLFGADRIPKLARSMGEAKKEFESASRGDAAPGGPSAASTDKPEPPTQTPALS
jgi:TatA/E family protein of Tat protein translocase